MKKNYLLIFGLLCFFTASAQITFTDARLKAKLVGASTTNETAKDSNGNPMVIDTNSNGEIEISEALNVYDLNVGAQTLSETIQNIVGLEYFTNMKKLNLRFFYATTLDLTAFPQLEELVCSNSTQLQSVNLTGLVNLKKLDCSSNLNFVTSLNFTGLPSLQYLDCSDNDLQTLNITGLAGLIELIANDNYLAGSMSWTAYPQLKKINLNNNTITGLNFSGLANLEEVYCNANFHLAAINLSGASTLKVLECGYNDLTSLNVQANTNLETLMCRSTKLTSLNLSGMAHLKSVDCGGITNASGQPCFASLNVSGCSSLLQLDCSGNVILSALNLGGALALEQLICNDNQLNSLDLTGAVNLKDLTCSNNPFTTLDLSNSTQLFNFQCVNSKLVTADLSDLASLTSMNLSSSTTLKNLLIKNGRSPFSNNYYFSDLPALTYLCADEQYFNFYTQILSNQAMTNVQLNSYCSFVPGGTYYTLNGTATYDEDGNGCDVSDPKVSPMRFNVGNGSNATSILSDENGQVSIPVQSGTHIFRANLENSSYFSVTPTQVSVNFPTVTSPFTQNFCLTANGSHPDLEISMLPIGVARPGFDAHYKLICRNKGTNTQSGTILLAFNDAILDFVGATPALNQQSANNLSWNFTNLRPFQTIEIALTLNVNSPVETPAVNGGDTLYYQASIIGSSEDSTVEDNFFGFPQIVVNSFDPNDKTCLEGTAVSPELSGKYVHYQIRFENTGTFAAENIVVKDIIDTSKFDINTLVPLRGSHPFVTRITGGNKVEFIFENINLPFNDANNDGFVMFKIKTYGGMQVGDTFSNTASIYFDYNAPIVTNTATSTFTLLAKQDFNFNDSFVVSPNPATDVLHIKAKNGLVANSIEIYTVTGQLVLAVSHPEKDKSIDVSDLRTGSYVIKVNSDKGSSSTKFVKN